MTRDRYKKFDKAKVPVGTLKPRREKMAAGITIASELLEMISTHSYTSKVEHIPVREVLPQKVYPQTPLSDIYWLDTRHCYRAGRKKNSNQLYEIFGLLSESDPNDVSLSVLDIIKQNEQYYVSVGHNHLKRLGLTLTDWILLMSSESVYADELMLFALAKSHQRHVVVFTKSHCWSTVGSDEPITGRRLLDICDIHLVYIGQHMYAELKVKPFATNTKRAVTHGPTEDVPSATNSDLDVDAIDLSILRDRSNPVNENKMKEIYTTDESKEDTPKESQESLKNSINHAQTSSATAAEQIPMTSDVGEIMLEQTTVNGNCVSGINSEQAITDALLMTEEVNSDQVTYQTHRTNGN